MERREVDEIERFLTSVGQPSLFAYYGVARGAPVEELEAALKKRRAWAQGQQANPKFKSEALFLIKQHALLRKALIEEPDALGSLDAGVSRALDALTTFIKGAIVDGTLSAAAEATVRHQGRQLQLSEAAITERIQEVLAEVGATRSVEDRDDVAETAAATDLYAVLGCSPESTQEQLEAAYRAKYKWARNLADLIRSQMLLKELDEAWRVLRDPARRARYDAARARVQAPEALPDGAAQPLSDLPPPLPSAPTVVLPVRDSGTSAGPSGVRRAEEAPAPAPRGISGRTLGVADGPQTVRARIPRLRVDATTISVRRADKPVRLGFRVRNEGQGPMPGRITTDAPWIELPVMVLDPSRADQEIPLVIHVDRAPAGALGTVTVSTDHGERKSLTVRLPPPNRTPLLLVLAGLMALGMAAAGGWWWLGQQRLAHEAELVLDVDPVADRVFVNGVPQGSGSHVVIRLAPASEPALVRVEADGFRPEEEKLDLIAGRRYTRALRLELDDPMEWNGPASTQPAMLGSEGAARVRAESKRFAECFTWAGAPVDATFSYTALVDGAGQVRKVTIEPVNYSGEKALPCLKRAFRGLRLPPVASGFGVIQDQLVIRPGGDR